MTPMFRPFSTSEQLASALADTVVNTLSTAIEARGQAVLAVSGGSTPARFFGVLSQRPLAWDRVTVVLVDERCVPPTHPRSNLSFVRRLLCPPGRPAGAARLRPLVDDLGRPCTDTDDILQFIDMAILGMGTDGHTASWFPGADRLDTALDPEAPPELLSTSAPGAPEPRVTLTWATLRTAGALVLHIEGPAKKAALQAALAPGPLTALPVRRVLFQDDVQLTIFADFSAPEPTP